jgi:hypothetical protein
MPFFVARVKKTMRMKRKNPFIAALVRQVVPLE